MKNNLFHRIMMVVVTLSLLGGCVSAPKENGKGISKSVLNLIDQAVFEVVIKKSYDTPETRDIKISEDREKEIIEEKFTYEKKLPWSALDFTSRTDEFYSIGTAFAISENELLTAAHVLSLDSKTLYGGFYIRDKSGNVYELDSVSKFANNRDFTVFTAKGLDKMNHFDLEFDYELNSNVYSVGNALGEGVIIRDGLLTSTTKETENGEWDYLRYSAAASPGNSGGPLLNNKGKVLGIVLKKSENENLNYALPIREVMDAKINTAVYHIFDSYGLSITQKKYGPVKYTEEIKLPLSYNDLRDKLSVLVTESNQLFVSELLSENSDSMFPYGEGSYNLLHEASSFGFPYIAAENQKDGIWGIYKPGEIEQSRLENNGFISYGKIAEFISLRFRKPLDVTLKSLMDDSEYFIELFLEAYPLNRYIGNQAVRITSLGAATDVDNFVDKYDRSWFVQSWDLDFANSKLMIYAMPVPSGFIAFALLSDVASVDQVQSQDMEEYLNYMFFSYQGTFLEWKEYLELDFPKSAIIENVEFAYTPGDQVFFKNSNFQVEYTEDLISIEDKSNLVLRASYRMDGDKPEWAPVGITMTSNFLGDNYVKLIKETKPQDSLTEDYHQNWNNLLTGKYPYDGSANTNEQLTYIDALQRQFSEAGKKDGDILYFVEVGMEGTKKDEEMGQYLELLQEGVTVTE